MRVTAHILPGEDGYTHVGTLSQDCMFTGVTVSCRRRKSGVLYKDNRLALTVYRLEAVKLLLSRALRAFPTTSCRTEATAFNLRSD